MKSSALDRLSQVVPTSYMLGDMHAGREQEIWDRATAIAGAGKARDWSDLESQMQAEFPETHIVLNDTKFSDRMSYLRELLHKRNRKR